MALTSQSALQFLSTSIATTEANSQKLQKELDELRHTSIMSSLAGKAQYTLLAKENQLLRDTVESLENQMRAKDMEISKLRVAAENRKKEEERQQETNKCLNAEMGASKPKDQNEFVQDEVTLPAFNISEVTHPEKISESLTVYQHFMNSFAPATERPHFFKLEPVCDVARNLHGYMASSANTRVFINHVLYMPGRSLWATAASHHALIFGPTHQYESISKTWIETSDLDGLDNVKREFFIRQGDQIFYAGTYKCHCLRNVYRGGAPAPQLAEIWPAEIQSAALLSGLNHIEKAAVIKKFPDGRIKTAAVGLQCVGFNRSLYAALRAGYRKPLAQGLKRKSEGQGGSEGKKAKKSA